MTVVLAATSAAAAAAVAPLHIAVLVLVPDLQRPSTIL
jgi:hypothetical protein